MTDKTLKPHEVDLFDLVRPSADKSSQFRVVSYYPNLSSKTLTAMVKKLIEDEAWRESEAPDEYEAP